MQKDVRQQRPKWENQEKINGRDDRDKLKSGRGKPRQKQQLQRPSQGVTQRQVGREEGKVDPEAVTHSFKPIHAPSPPAAITR